MSTGLYHERREQEEIKAEESGHQVGGSYFDLKVKLKKCQLNKIHFKRLLLIELKFNLATFRTM